MISQLRSFFISYNFQIICCRQFLLSWHSIFCPDQEQELDRNQVKSSQSKINKLKYLEKARKSINQDYTVQDNLAPWK